MTSKAKGIRLRNRASRLTPTTRAIRHALALGLAITAAQPAFADGCDPAVTQTSACAGGFVDTSVDFAVDDPSRVVGADLPIFSGRLLSGIAARAPAAEVLSIVVDDAIAVSVVGMGDATGLPAAVGYGDVEVVVTDTGSVNASTDNLDGGTATGVYASSQVGNLTVANHGDIGANAGADYGDAMAIGVVAHVSYIGIALVLNDGAIAADAHVDGDGSAAAVGMYAVADVATVVNDGDVAASAFVGNGQADASAIEVYGSWAGAFNYGSLAAAADVTTGDAIAFGIDAYAISGSTIANSGDIVASASAVTGNASAGAVRNFAYFYGAYVTNDGRLAADAITQDGNASATGIVNIAFLYGHADTTNSGDIVANATVTGSGAAEATGIYGYAFVYGPQIVNSGRIIADATAAAGSSSATGIETSFYHGDSLVRNDGLIAATATTSGGQFGGAYAYGVVINHEVGKYNFPNVAIVNNGDIAVAASHGGGYGFAGATGIRTSLMYATQQNYGDISASAIATGEYGIAEASGAVNLGKYGVVDTNDGRIVASAQAHLGGRASASGVNDIGVYLDTTTINRGVIGAYAESVFDGAYGGNAEATALYAHANYAASVDNSGTLVARARADHGRAGASGVAQSSKYAVSTLVNSGDIAAVAQASAGYAEATGSDVNSKYGGITINNGTIHARALADGGVAEAVGSVTVTPGAHGYNLDAVASQLYNLGEISAFASADGGQASALGSRVVASNDAGAWTHNEGTISALAEAAGGNAFAVGSNTFSYYGEVRLANDGDILARADGDVDGHALAVGGIVSAAGGFSYHSGNAVLFNSGIVAAAAYGGLEATAIGMQMDGESGATADNDARISALAESGTGLAQAAGLVMASSAGGIDVTNWAGIIATANGGADSTAFGVHLTSAGVNTLTNMGSIVADGSPGTHVAVWSSDDAIAAIANHGTLIGGIRTGSLDDTLVNHAGATLVLEDATVDLGGYSVAGNTFANAGTIVAFGASVIDMGQGPNPFAFENSGTIDFRDGAAADVLTIAGDLDGDGQLYMDVSGLHGVADLLYVDGNVAAGSTSTLNLHLLDMPTSAASDITLVRVAGDSNAGSFVLGNVTYAQNSFLALAFDTNLTSRIDAGNAQADEFALGVQVTGLNDTGALAAAIAPGAQSLLNTQVGTWRQRMGAMAAMARGGVNLWARFFRNEGTVAPALERSNFGDGGNLAFDQENSGTEVGADFAFSDIFSAGVLLAKSDARQTLDGAGVGSTRIDADTHGLYATVLTPGGFYLDTSYRRMRFDARVATTGGEIHGDADAFNLEAGVTWTLGNGVAIQPQFQSTWTQVASVGELSGDLAQFVLDGGNSTRSRLGVMASRRFASGNSAWTPYASVNAVHEWDGTNAYSINGDFFGATSTQGTSALVEAGVSLSTGRLSLHGGLNWQDGGALESVVGGQLNVRYAW